MHCYHRKSDLTECHRSPANVAQHLVAQETARSKWVCLKIANKRHKDCHSNGETDENPYARLYEWQAEWPSLQQGKRCSDHAERSDQACEGHIGHIRFIFVCLLAPGPWTEPVPWSLGPLVFDALLLCGPNSWGQPL